MGTRTTLRADDFVSTPDDYQECAIAFGDAQRRNGWKLTVEPQNDLAYPRTPVFRAERRQTVRLIEIQNSIDSEQLDAWVRYAKTSDVDTRICVVINLCPPGLVADEVSMLKELGVGLFTRDSKTGPFTQLLAPVDLGMQIELPTLPEALMPLLGEAFEQFDGGYWREGFEYACTVLEQEAREYIRSNIRRRRLTFMSSAGKSVAYRDDRIRTMTIGALARCFSEIRSPNSSDSRIGSCLRAVNANRVTSAHHKGKSRVSEKRLRAQVPRQMFIIVNGLREIKGC